MALLPGWWELGGVSSSQGTRQHLLCQVAFRKFNTQHDTHTLTNIHTKEKTDYEPTEKARYLLCARCCGNTNELHLAPGKRISQASRRWTSTRTPQRRPRMSTSKVPNAMQCISYTVCDLTGSSAHSVRLPFPLTGGPKTWQTPSLELSQSKPSPEQSRDKLLGGIITIQGHLGIGRGAGVGELAPRIPLAQNRGCPTAPSLSLEHYAKYPQWPLPSAPRAGSLGTNCRFLPELQEPL